MKKEIRIESKAMVLGAVLNFMMAFAGIYMYYVTGMVALFLDGSFSFVSALSCLMAVCISRYSNTKTKSFPNGLFFLEPLYGVLKSLIVLVVTVSAFVSAVSKLISYFVYHQGVIMNMGYMLWYMVLMVVLCLGLYGIFELYNKKISYTSIMLSVEAKAALVDTCLSLGIGIVVLVIMVVPVDGMFGFLHYVGDSLLTIVLVLMTFRQPYEALKSSFVELVYGREKSLIDQTVQEIVYGVNEKLDQYTIEEVVTIKTGKRIAAIVRLNIQDTEIDHAKIQAFKKAVRFEMLERYGTVLVSVLI